LWFHGKMEDKLKFQEPVFDNRIPKHSNPTYQDLKCLIPSSWKRLARVGIAGDSKNTEPNVTNCESGKAIPGLSVVDGIIFISDPKKLAKLQSVIACVEEGPGVKLEMTDGDACSDTAWCSELETEEQCRGSCHGVTGGAKEAFSHDNKCISRPGLSLEGW
jgi:hypothetical protein